MMSPSERFHFGARTGRPRRGEVLRPSVSWPAKLA